MMSKTILRLVALSFIVSFADIAYVNADSAEKQGLDENITISIVDDEAEWPPYTYYQRINGEKNPKIVGFSIDVITRIFNQEGVEFTVELPPWKRALFNVARGEKNQLILNSSHVKEREVDYLYSLVHYTLQHVIFYSATKYPEGLVLKDMEDLNANYKICGLRGYSYGSAGVDTNKVNLSFGTHDQLIHVLHNRPEICDLFIEGYEIFAGFKVIGSDYLADKNLKYGVIPGLSSKGYHMLISKNLSYSKELKEIIDKEILLLRESGELDLLLAKYGLIH